MLDPRMNLALLVLLATGVISKLDFNPPADEPIMVNHKNCPIWVVHILYFIDGKYYFYICLLFNLIKNCCLIKKVLIFWQIFKAKRIEYIIVEFKKCKTAILLYCFHTAGVLHIFKLYNLLGPGILFYRKSKINIKRNPNYEIGWFHN